MATPLARQVHFRAAPPAMFTAALALTYSRNIAGKWPLGPSGKRHEQNARPSGPFQGRPAG
eukprot:5714753-Alexandrium_andersonii.AAC.1